MLDWTFGWWGVRVADVGGGVMRVYSFALRFRT